MSNFFEFAMYVLTRGLKLDVLTQSLYPIWPFIAPILILLAHFLINKQVKSKTVSWIPLLYSPMLTSLIVVRSSLLFFIFFVVFVQFYMEKRYGLAALVASISILARPDGFVLWG